MISGIDVTVGNPYSGTVIYKSLDISLGVTSVGSLNPTFAVNLPKPMTVLSLRPPNSTIQYTLNAWTSLKFTTPYPYPGTGNLVLEFRKQVQAQNPAVDTFMKVPSEPRRFDLVPQINATGPGAHLATMASPAGLGPHPLRMRLWFQDGRSMTVQNTPGGVRGHEFALGTTVITTVHAAPGDEFWSFIDFQGLGFTLQPWSIPGLRGICHLNVSPWLLLVGQGLVKGGNSGTSSFQLPTLTYFVGKKITFQSIAGTLATGYSFTPASDAIINW